MDVWWGVLTSVAFLFSVVFGVLTVLAYVMHWNTTTNTPPPKLNRLSASGLVLYLNGVDLVLSDPTNSKSVVWTDNVSGLLTFTPTGATQTKLVVEKNTISGLNYIRMAAPLPDYSVGGSTSYGFVGTCAASDGPCQAAYRQNARLEGGLVASSGSIPNYPIGGTARSMFWVANGGAFHHVAASDAMYSTFSIQFDREKAYLVQNNVGGTGFWTYATLDPNRFYAFVVVRNGSQWSLYIIEERTGVALQTAINFTGATSTSTGVYNKPEQRLLGGTKLYAHAVYSGAMNDAQVAQAAQELFNDTVRPNITYPTTPVTLTMNQTSGVAVQSKVRGTITTLTVAPDLPTGLTLNPTTGEVTGTPTVVAETAVYTVTLNGNENNTATFTLAVQPDTSIVVPEPPPPPPSPMPEAATSGSASAPTDTTTSESYDVLTVGGLGAAAIVCAVAGTAFAVQWKKHQRPVSEDKESARGQRVSSG